MKTQIVIKSLFEGKRISQSLISEWANKLTPADLLAMAKIGLDALIDGATDSQWVKARNALKERIRKYNTEGR